ncbi:exopolysaccharide biosynthesis polyprenyl glycosylphosphotransferase [Neisseria shayeganii]|uniref:Exopolysaccharide biosynthesis polyprenyl glycosylphosphotransferase n=1 Tax=Neisseria shayeganii TaxID=607712 RepID=A0A7D7N9Z7_9NEIS|nr:exopolysaccharide biosynthesis polyprenyl glycosylphosphotransferase [Neisseria shayeganii]QMT40897.1 exopolysaccharide biosynthesis polyprenyl glycosylphosphotransferase [Neisseria shayeganii]
MSRFLYSFPIRLWLGVGISAFLPYIILLPWLGKYQGHAYVISMLAVAIAHFVSAKSLFSITNYPGRKSVFSVLPNSVLWFLSAWAVLKILGLPYSLWFLLLGFITSYAVCLWGFRLRTRKQPVLAYLPFSKAANANLLPDVHWIELANPIDIPPSQIQGYVADLHDPNLHADWQKFLAEQVLKGIPVYHIRAIEESLTGRLKIHHMYENSLGSLLPSKNYMLIKYLLDFICILVSLPITLPLMLMTAIAIKLESSGPVLFVQNRVGLGGKEFKIYKFRSMCIDSEKDGAKLAAFGDMRVTKVGRFIRKVRIDELPQFFNIIKGDMSLIGPRPEQKAFVDEFEEKIPFYNYRHVVKPGISGWAQVMHGYAANVDETQVKVEHDFYYIKHFSFSLDVLIFFKTIKTMLTGFGAR